MSPAFSLSVPGAIQVLNGDFDNDNNTDLAVLTSDSISILLGDGAGGFGSPITTSLSTAPTSFAVGDFTGDGDLDVAVAYDTTSVDTFIGAGDGTFGSTVESTFTVSMRKITAIDLNQDSYQDIVGADTSGVFALSDNSGSGLFGTSQGFTSSSNVVDLAVGDFDNDGNEDVFLAYAGSINVVVVLLSNADGTYGTPILNSTTGTSVPTGVAVGNFDGNAKADFVVSFSNAAPRVYRATSLNNLTSDSVTFGPTGVNLPSGSDVLALNLNDDGSSDIAVFNATAGTLTVAVSDGDGGYTVDPDGAYSVTGTAVHAADLNGDGVDDIAVANTTNDTVDLYFCRFRTTTKITNSTTSVGYGDALTINAQVLPVFDASQNTNYGKLRGSVQFYIDGVLAGSSTVSLLGQASLTVPTTLAKLPVGTPSITAKFTGNFFFGPSTSAAFKPTVTKGTVGVSINGPTTSTYGDNVSFTLTLTPPAVPPSVTGPTGTVDFYMDGSTLLGSASVVETTAPYTYKATLDTNKVLAGTRTITAFYAGDSNWFSASTPTNNNVTITVAKATPTINLIASPTGPIVIGNTVNLTADLTVPTGTSATGTIKFTNNTTTTLGQPTITTNSAQLTNTALPLGGNTIVASYAGDSNFNAATSNSVTVQVNTANQQYIDNVYQLLLGRAPDAGAAGWVNLLNAGVSPANVVFGMQGSNEYLTRRVNTLYQTYLGRTAGSDAAGWVTFLTAGGTFEEMTVGILGSAEYTTLHTTNSNFVTALYQEVFGRTPSSTELNGWVNLLNAGATRVTVAAGFVYTIEYKNDLVQSYYSTFLGRPANGTEQTGWVDALADGLTDQQLLASIFGSPEGYAKWSA